MIIVFLPFYPCRGVTLVHKGSKVSNIIACNGIADLTGLKRYKLKVQDPKTKKVYEVGNYSTEFNKRKLSHFPDSVCMLLHRSELRDDESHENFQSIADSLKLDVNDMFPHWWSCFILENKQAVHVDLCGPAYDLFHYRKSISGPIAPVYMVELLASHINNLPPSVHEKYPHKFHLSNLDLDNSRIIKFPDEFRGFRFHNESILEVTPLDAYLERKKDEPLFGNQSIENIAVLYSLRNAIEIGENIYVKLKNIVQREELNGQILPVCGVNKDRVAVRTNIGSNIGLKTEKMTIEGGCKQIVTFKEMREIINHAEETTKKEIMEKFFDVGDSVIIRNVTGNLDLNGQEGTIVENRAASSNQLLIDDLFVVELFKTKKKCLVKRQNIDLVKTASVNKEKEKRIKYFLTRDPLGITFYRRVILSSNFGLTNLTEPDILPAFEKLVKLGFGKNFLKSATLQTNFERILEVSKMNKFKEFRIALQCIRKGVTPEQHKRLMDGKPEFETIMEKCNEYGILKLRSTTNMVS